MRVVRSVTNRLKKLSTPHAAFLPPSLPLSLPPSLPPYLGVVRQEHHRVTVIFGEVSDEPPEEAQHTTTRFASHFVGGVKNGAGGPEGVCERREGKWEGGWEGGRGE